jgi:hypothetical protein
MRSGLVALFLVLASGAASCATGSGDIAGNSTVGGGGAPADGGAPVPEAGAGGSSAAGAGGSSAAGTGGAPSTSTDSGGSTTAAGPAVSYASTPPLLVTTEVSGTYDMDLTCGDLPILHACAVTTTGDKNVPYTLPPGTVRSSILYTITPVGLDAGGAVTFASTDPNDGTVHVHGYAGAFSSVHIEVTGVMAIAQ